MGSVTRRAVHTVFTLIMLFSEASFAAQNSYACKLTGWHSSRPDEFISLYSKVLDEEIYVDRQTGVANHPAFGNSYFNNIYLLNRGDQSWSFKVFADSGRQAFNQGNSGGHTHYMEINEFSVGEKPMVAIIDGNAIWGVCN
jgi:hypothetical protein